MFVCIVVLGALKSSLMAKGFPRINKISNPIHAFNPNTELQQEQLLYVPDKRLHVLIAIYL